MMESCIIMLPGILFGLGAGLGVFYQINFLVLFLYQPSETGVDDTALPIIM